MGNIVARREPITSAMSVNIEGFQDFVLLDEKDISNGYSASYQPTFAQLPEAQTVHQKIFRRLEEQLKKKTYSSKLSYRETQASKNYMGYIESRKEKARKFLERRDRAVETLKTRLAERQKELELNWKKKFERAADRKQFVEGVSTQGGSSSEQGCYSDYESEIDAITEVQKRARDQFMSKLECFQTRIEQKQSSAAERRQQLLENKMKRLQKQLEMVDKAYEKRQQIDSKSVEVLQAIDVKLEDAERRRRQMLEADIEKLRRQFERFRIPEEPSIEVQRERLEKKENDAWARHNTYICDIKSRLQETHVNKATKRIGAQLRHDERVKQLAKDLNDKSERATNNRNQVVAEIKRKCVTKSYKTL